MTREEQIKQAANEFAYSLCSIRPELNADSFMQGAMWADRHHSYNYDGVSEKMIEHEVSFIDEWLVTHDNMLTFADALEWEKKRVVDKVVEWLKGYLSYEGTNEAWSEILITNFRKAMEE